MTVNRNDMKPDWVDPDDAPELTDEWFDKATMKVAGKTVRRGRPIGSGSGKQAISIRLDPDVIAKFKATGPGWQGRINEALRRARV